MNKEKNIIKQAIKLTELGFSVIPIDTKTKKPLIGWGHYQNKIANEFEIEGWFENWPDMGLGVVTGRISNLVVFDIDPRHNGEKDQFEKYDTVCNKTGGGGWHYYFKYPKSSPIIRNTVNIFKGIDIRAEGGYVIVPPSEHPSGNNYEWLKSPFEKEVLGLPVELEKKIRNKKESSLSAFDPEVLDGVPRGQRNQTAASVAGKIVRGLRKDEFETVGWPMLEAWNDRNSPPLPLDELKRTFTSICNAELRRKKGEVTEIEISQELMTAGQVLKVPVEEDLWIIEDLIPKGCTFISGQPASYKTYIALHIAKCLTYGEKLFGKFKVHRRRTMVFDRENPKQLVKKRLRQLSFKDKNIPFFNFNYTPVNSKGFKDSFIRLLKERRIEMVIFDSFRRFFVGEENSSEQIADFFAFVDQIKAEDISVIFLHHHRKINTFFKEDLSQAMRGSSDLIAYPDCHIAIKKTMDIEERQVKFVPVKLRVAIKRSPFLITVENPTEDTIDFSYKLSVPSDEEKPRACRLDLLEVFEKKQGAELDRKMFYEMFHGKYGRNLIRDTLKRLVEDGKVLRDKDGRRYIYKLRIDNLEENA